LASFDLGGFLQNLTASSGPTVGPRVVLTIDAVANVRASVKKALPIGLAVSELLSNAAKHAFPNDRPGAIQVKLAREDDNVACITVADDGIGLPEDFDLRQQRSSGVTIIRLLTEQIGAQVTIERSGGTLATIRIPLLDEDLHGRVGAVGRADGAGAA
jgi:two-component sensor histidine kinase